MSSSNTHPNPYVGPRAFDTGEKLYGRDREARELLDHLIAERVVVVYSPSGAGKTSLIRAGLIPGLRQEGFQVLPVARVSIELPYTVETNSQDQPADNSQKISGVGQENNKINRYVYSTLISLEENLPEDKQTPVDRLAGMTLGEYLAQRPQERDTTDQEGGLQSQVLVFDQFEEILTIDPTDHECKAEFFDQVGSALRDRHRWALFAIREDFVAALDPYLKPIPTRLSNRFRLDLLGVEAARQAIQSPARLGGVDFTDQAARKLIDDLRRIQVQQPDGSMQEVPGLYVEPVQLQVVCYRLWQNLSPTDKQIAESDVEKVGDVNQSLSDYYSERVAVIAGQTGTRERAIRDWFQYKLITEHGIRGQVLMGREQSDGLDNRVIRLLEDAHLIRAEKRRGATWFELAHDRLIMPVQTNNEAWFQANLSLLQRQASLWQKDNRPEHLLLREEALQEAEEWSAGHPDELTATERDFLQVCLEVRQHEQEKRERQEQAIKLQEQARSARRLRILLVMAVIAAVAAVFFATAAARTSRQNAVLADLNATNAAIAQANSTEAIAQRATAQVNANIAQAASTQANNERATADFARATAQAASTEAIAQRATAEYNAGVAQVNAEEADFQASLASSRQLAAQGSGYINSQPDLSSLLAVEAYRSANTWEAKSILLLSLERGLSETVQPYGKPIPDQEKDLFSVAMSPDGQHLAWGTSDGKVVLWNYQTGDVVWNRQEHGANKVVALDFSPDGKTLASGALDGQIIVWNLNNEDIVKIQNRNNVNTLAYSPGGARLAAGIGEQIVLWDATTLEPTRPPLENLARAWTLAWSPDGSHLAVGSDTDGTISVWEPDNLDKDIPDLRLNHGDMVLSVDWSPEGNLMASAGQDGKIHIWDMDRGREVGEPLPGPLLSWVHSVSFSTDGRYLASGSADGAVVIWDVSNLRQIASIDDHNDVVQSLEFSPILGELVLASVGIDNVVGLDTIIAQQPLSQPVLSGEGAVIALGSGEDGTIFVARLTNSGVSLTQIKDSSESIRYTFSGNVSNATFSADSKRLALGFRDGKVQFLDVDTGTQITLFQASQNVSPVFSLAIHPDGRILATSHCTSQLFIGDENKEFCSNNEIYLWNLDDGKRLSTILTNHTNLIRALAFDPSGSLLASGSDDQTIMLWDWESGTQEGLPLARHKAGITSLLFSSDGSILASGSDDRDLILWDILNNRQQIGEALAGSTGSVLSLFFSQDNKSLFSGTPSGSILSWDVNPDSWAERVCELAGRNLTELEWQLFLPQTDYTKTCPRWP